ncbi:MAG: hypothetical protein ABI697_04450 [Devosia sp.]
MSSHATAAHRPVHSIGFTLGVIALCVAVGATGLAYIIDAVGRAARRADSASVVVRTLGETPLTIPAAWLASDPGDDSSFARQIDLAISIPIGAEGAPRRIDVTLTQRSRVRPSASLLDGVYLHQFQPAQLSGPVGLIGKPLEARDGYENETVWYDPINPSPFVAKCSAPIADGQPGRCLRTVYLGPGIAAVYGFDDDVLVNWKKFDAELHPLLAKIGAL